MKFIPRHAIPYCTAYWSAEDQARWEAGLPEVPPPAESKAGSELPHGFYPLAEGRREK